MYFYHKEIISTICPSNGECGKIRYDLTSLYCENATDFCNDRRLIIVLVEKHYQFDVAAM